jgi:hypothetical protein
VKRFLPLVLLLSALLLVAGCGGGGGGGSRLSKADYEKRMTAIGTELQKKLTGLGSSASTSDPKKAGTAFTTLADALNKTANEVDAINPPSNIDKPHQDFADGLHAFANDVRGVGEKAKKGDVAAIQKFGSGVQALPSAKKLQAASTAIKNKGYNIGA